MAASDAKPIPIRAAAYRVTFPILDADGDLVAGAAGLDSEFSEDAAAFADCTNEATEIATSSGMYYLDLANTEMDGDTVAVIIKSSSGKTTPIVMYPNEAGDIDVDVTAISGSAVSTSSAQLGVNVVNAAGTAWGSGAITAGAIAADAITAAKIADGAIDANTFAAGAINAAAIATGAIDADALASDAATEIRSIASGTADSGSTTTMVDAARTEADTDYWKGALIVFTSGTIAGQVRLITGFTPGTDTITFSPATTQAVGTNTYEIWPAGRADVGLWNGSAPSNLISGRLDVDVGAMQSGVLTATAIAAGAITAAKFAAGAIDAAAIATGAIDADSLAADAVDKIWDEAMTEIAAVPGVTASFRDALRWMFALSRNKITQTATTQTLRNDADNASIATAAVSDDATTATRGEWA